MYLIVHISPLAATKLNSRNNDELIDSVGSQNERSGSVILKLADTVPAAEHCALIRIMFRLEDTFSVKSTGWPGLGTVNVAVTGSVVPNGNGDIVTLAFVGFAPLSRRVRGLFSGHLAQRQNGLLVRQKQARCRDRAQIPDLLVGLTNVLFKTQRQFSEVRCQRMGLPGLVV